MANHVTPDRSSQLTDVRVLASQRPPAPSVADSKLNLGDAMEAPRPAGSLITAPANPSLGLEVKRAGKTPSLETVEAAQEQDEASFVSMRWPILIVGAIAGAMSAMMMKIVGRP